jgi:DNA mismatch repair protein MutS2
MVTHEHSLARLDFFRLRERLEGYCLSYEGQALMRSTLPCSRSESVQRLKQDLAALVEGLNNRDLPSLPFPNIETLVPKAQKEGMLLEVDELFAIGLWAKSYEQLFAFLRSILHSPQEKGRGRSPSAAADSGADGGDSGLFPDEGTDSEDDECWAMPGIERIAFSAPSVSQIQEKIFAVVTVEGEMRDLPRTRSLRAAIQKVQAENHRLVNQYLSDPNLQDALQSNAATERDNRTVIAIKANFRGRIKGIVHEFSSTGQTVFIEPIELVERNNRLLELETRLGEEIRAILRETADALRPLFPAVVRGRRFLAAADVRLARALQLKREDLAIAQMLDSGVHLYQARHPLLGKKAVPIDVDIPEGTSVLIITGPNTGGKTVSLKTIGLLALLNQYGAGIPASSTSGFAVFDTVCADIGDEQSIDQSLSTFSGHMSVISDIAASATGRSLVLLDELGAGTDPEEGCAIAMALLDYFLGRRCMTIVTTHHGVLKNYGYTKPGCLNASMEFNAHSLSPTYRIFMGVPGESRALEIARQTGLSSKIVDAARSYLDDERSDYSALIRSLGEKQRELDLLERERRKQLQGALESRRRADLENLKLRQKELELRRQGVAELGRFLSESRKTFENLVREIRESGRKVEEVSAGREVLQNISDELARFEEETEALERATRSEQDDVQNIDAAALKAGEKVLFQNREAVFLRSLDDKRVLVQIGALRLPVAVDALSLPRAGKRKDADTRLSYQVELSGASGGGAKASPELDVRGMRLAEALEVLTHQIDAASLAGLDTFSVIHGTGEGILAKGIHDWLKTQAAVADYYFARPEDGGFGKTWIHLKA